MDAMFIPLAYGMTGLQVRNTLNANSLALETYSLKEAITDDIEEGLSYTDFIYYVNDKLTRPANSMALDPAEYTLLTTETVDIVSLININYDIVLDQTTTFRGDGKVYWFDIKQVRIPEKGVANILSQNGLWKFGYFTGETILYISADGGITWPYSEDFASISAYSLDNIKFAQIFSDGNIFFALKQNKLYASYNLLATLVEETMMDIDGVTPLPFHEPMNALYPGMYFGSVWSDKPFWIDGIEMIVWGNYPPHVNYGAAPISIYFKKNNNINPRAIYHFGQNSFYRDNGLGAGYTTADEIGNLIGDPDNPVVCVHSHGLTQNETNGDIWAAVGDTTIYDEVHFLKLIYNLEEDSWVINVYDMTDPFRNMELRFYNNGNDVLWASDSNCKIYKVSYANLTSTNIADHIAKYNGVTPLTPFIGITKYDKYIMANCMYPVPLMAVSVNYGETWYQVPANYLYALGDGEGYISRIKDTDSEGFYLLQISPDVLVFDAKKSYLVKLHEKII